MPPNAENFGMNEALVAAVLSIARAVKDPAGGGLPTGSIVDFGGNAPPDGWLMCTGAAVSRTTYSGLFAVLGTTFGAGDGSTTFNIPDYRGRVGVGEDDMGGTAASRITTGGSGVNGAVLGSTGGAETHTLTQAQMPAHIHGYDAISTDSAANGSLRPNVKDAAADRFPSTNSTGGGGAHNNVQPSIIVSKIIKV